MYIIYICTYIYIYICIDQVQKEVGAGRARRGHNQRDGDDNHGEPWPIVYSNGNSNNHKHLVIIESIVTVIVIVRRQPWRALAMPCATPLRTTAATMSSKQRDPNPNKNSLIRKKCCNAEWNPLCVDAYFLTKESSLGLGSLCVLLRQLQVLLLPSLSLPLLRTPAIHRYSDVLLCVAMTVTLLHYPATLAVQLSGAYRLEGTTLANRLAASRNYNRKVESYHVMLLLSIMFLIR